LKIREGPPKKVRFSPRTETVRFYNRTQLERDAFPDITEEEKTRGLEKYNGL
jgi:hypothetical protein